MSSEKEIIIKGDYNQHIGGNETQQFYREIGVQDILSGREKISWNDGHVTFKRGSKFIDSIAVSEGMMPFIERFEVIEWDEKVYTDHRGHVIEFNIDFVQ